MFNTRVSLTRVLNMLTRVFNKLARVFGIHMKALHARQNFDCVAERRNSVVGNFIVCVMCLNFILYNLHTL